MCSNVSETYARLLLHQGYGYPLWIPEPNEALPEQYLVTGVRIGDVGLVTPDGAFDFLFNVFLSADDIINQWHGVPEGFTPLSWNERMLTVNSQRHQPGVPISSSGTKFFAFSVEASAPIPGVPVAVGGGIELKFTQSRGAVLMLPSGASRVDYRNLSALREYAANNAEGWYQFVNGPSLGLEAQNGSLYLVTGYDKTNAWEVAAFSNPEREQTVSIKFSSGVLGDGKLSMTRSSMLQSFLSSRSHLDSNAKNQAVFVRGFKIRLRQGAKSRLWGPVKVMNVMGMTPKDIMYRGGIYSPPSSSQSSSSNSGSTPGKEAGNDMDSNSLGSTFSDIGSPGYSSSSSGSEELNLQMYHPSNIINDYILDKFSGVDVAITHDDDWCSVLRESDTEFPSDSEITKRIEQNGDIRVSGSGYAFWVSRSPSAENNSIEPSDSDAWVMVQPQQSHTSDTLDQEDIVALPKPELNVTAPDGVNVLDGEHYDWLQPRGDFEALEQQHDHTYTSPTYIPPTFSDSEPFSGSSLTRVKRESSSSSSTAYSSSSSTAHSRSSSIATYSSSFTAYSPLLSNLPGGGKKVLSKHLMKLSSPEYNRPSIPANIDEDSDEEPLPPSASDKEKLDWRRRKNTQAARRSRKRKMLYTEQLETTVERLIVEKETWRTRALTLRQLLISHGLPSPDFEDAHDIMDIDSQSNPREIADDHLISEGDDTVRVHSNLSNPILPRPAAVRAPSTSQLFFNDPRPTNVGQYDDAGHRTQSDLNMTAGTTTGELPSGLARTIGGL